MSAIWGVIDLEKNSISDTTIKVMREAFNNCVIDRIEEKVDSNVYMACGIQYFTKESKSERLPIMKDEYCCTADIVLDNRDELLDKLGINQNMNDEVPDGDILCDMYETYGEGCLNDLIGAYSFVWYDKKKNKVDIVVDSVGNRCLYYMVQNNQIFFSSLMRPLVELCDELEMDNNWGIDFLALDTIDMFSDTQSTPLKNIYRVAPAQYISISREGISREIYWKPLEGLDTYDLDSDEICKEKYLTLWEKVVISTMRTEKYSILLSGGMDSTAVAAIAAPYLKDKGKYLDSYTSVPMKDYKVDEKIRGIVDESDLVKKTAIYYGNINTEFIGLDDVDIWSVTDEIMQELEYPYKSPHNILWIREALKRAYNKESRQMFIAGYGNYTVSFSGILSYLYNIFDDKKRFDKEVELFCNKRGASADVVKRNIAIAHREEYRNPYDMFGKSFINKKVAEKTDINEYLANYNKRLWDLSRNCTRAMNDKVNWIALRQIGELQTKLSLSTGVLLRDPTCDKRLIEFCLRLPMEQYCKNGEDRRLVSVYMKDIVPEHILYYGKKGVQGADIKYRTSQNWEQIRNMWVNYYKEYDNNRLVNSGYARHILMSESDIEKYEPFDLMRHMYTINYLKYEDYLKRRYNAKTNSSEGCLNKSISFVVYVDKDGHEIDDCVHRLCQRMRDDYEILVMIREECDKYEQRDERVKIISQSFASRYDAYNKALEEAKGNWIAFVSIDDILTEDVYEKIFEIIGNKEYDFVACGNIAENMNLYRENALYLYISNVQAFPTELSNYLFNTQFLRDISISERFRGGLYGIMEKVIEGIVIKGQITENSNNSGKRILKSISQFVNEYNIKINLSKKYYPKMVDKLYIEYLEGLNLKKKESHISKEEKRAINYEIRKIRSDVKNILKIKDICGKKRKLKLYMSLYT